MRSLEAAQASFVATINGGPSLLDPLLFSGPVDRVLLGLKAHANTINHARLVALEESFPLVRAEMGDAAFNDLCRDYVQTPPARAADIALIGHGLPAFLQKHVDFAYLEDLAAIEYGWLESYHAGEATPLGLDRIACLTEAALVRLPVAAHPSLRLHRLHGPLPVALRNVAGEWIDPHSILLVRPETEVRLLALDATTAAVAALALAGATIGNLLQVADELSGNGETIAPVLTLVSAGALIEGE